MSEQDKNELIHSLMRLRKRCCGGVSAACMTTNHRMAKDNAEFQKIIQGVKALIVERDEARRLLKAVVDMMRDNMAPDATHPKHVCDFIYCPEIATCMVCENWTDALVMCYPDDFQDEEETK